MWIYCISYLLYLPELSFVYLQFLKILENLSIPRYLKVHKDFIGQDLTLSRRIRQLPTSLLPTQTFLSLIVGSLYGTKFLYSSFLGG